jgi:hypothetical protein
MERQALRQEVFGDGGFDQSKMQEMRTKMQTLNQKQDARLKTILNAEQYKGYLVLREQWNQRRGNQGRRGQ